MTYALAWPLQQGLYGLLTATPAVTALTGDRIFDAPVASAADETPDALYVTLGDERAEPWDTATDRGARHVVAVLVHAPRRGFAEAKQAAGAICDALLGATPVLSRGRVVDIRFAEGRTRRAAGDALRVIELRFLVTLEDT